MLSAHERLRVIHEFNQTPPLHPACLYVHQMFEDQVRRTPDAAAVTSGQIQLTYAELNARANQLASFLLQLGVGPEDVVGVCLERSIEMVVGLFGILKAGGAYVPIDPHYPPDRIEYMLRDSAPTVLLTQARLTAGLPRIAARVIELDAGWSAIADLPAQDLDPASIGLLPANLAYVIYTSGSTGRPKGAMNEHRAVVNRLQWMQAQYPLSARDSVLQKTPFSFDVSVWEFFWTLSAGARLVIARPDGHKDPRYMSELVDAEEITVMHFVPSMLHSFLDQIPGRTCASLKRIVCSGEELTEALQIRCLQSLPAARLANLYGPTEAAVDVTAWECTVAADQRGVPIGRPISNIQMYVLDAMRQPVAVGCNGEIFIGGVGVGRGYRGRPGLTAERFVADSFSATPGQRLYATGDVGRWREDGAIEYLGRNDDQVKIRGFRIELGEIEACLQRNPRVRESIVMVREGRTADKELTAYLVAVKTPGTHQPRHFVPELRAELRRQLPEYMVPNHFILLDVFPLTPNGKLDRSALPVAPPAGDVDVPYEAPQGEVETILTEVWQQVLGVEKVGCHDNFFNLGGHSLLWLKILAAASARLEVRMPMIAAHQGRTVREFALLVELIRSGNSAESLDDSADRGEEVVL